MFSSEAVGLIKTQGEKKSCWRCVVVMLVCDSCVLITTVKTINYILKLNVFLLLLC